MTFSRRDFLKKSAAAIVAEHALSQWFSQKAWADSGAAMNYHRLDHYADQPSDSEFLRALVTTVPNGAVIAYGSGSASLEAATVVRDAIRRIPGQSQWNQMVAAAEFDAQPFAVTGQTHVIAVGTLHDNPVLSGRGWLPTWWMDWNWYNSSFAWSLSREKIGLPYQPNSGFTAAGYGHWPADEGSIGLIEVDRSHLFMEWVVRSRIESFSGGPVPGSGNDKYRGNEKMIPNRGPVDDRASFQNLWPVYPRDFPMRLIVRVTGTGPGGLMAAADALADRQMLSGVVNLNRVDSVPGPAQSTLLASRYADTLPFMPPTHSGDYTYLGWLLPDAFEYDGLLADTGVAPLQMYRLKYMPKAGMTSFWTTPHKRAGEFEIACLKFADAGAAQAAGQKIDQAARQLQPFQDGRITNWGVAANGPNLYLRSMVGADGQNLLNACASLSVW